MSPFPRLRQSCRGERGGNEGADVPPGHDPRLVLNRLFLSGVLAAEPQRDVGRDGDSVTLLLVAFPAPDKRIQERPETASCEIEVPARVAERHRGDLHAGDSIFITGQLSGGGGVIATEIHSGPPPDSGRAP
jgi:Single-strand binding protein family